MKNRVYCLYRVSTLRQVDFDDQNQTDIPMQRRECHKFAEKMGWEIVSEAQEDGISGYKVRASDRDKIQLLREYAKNGKFDILLVYMFDRLGRIADETPFILEWFVKNGIQVWSTQEGEQRFDSHTDKLINYIRFWQADGESEKTSIRTKTGLGQLVEDGHFKGGTPPFGYDLIKGDRINKRKHHTHDLIINPLEADIVKIIFDRYINWRYGALRIAAFLNESGVRTKKGNAWHPASIRHILINPTYCGILRSGESYSQVLPQLQIIDPPSYSHAQEIMKQRKKDYIGEKPVLNIRANALLAGFVYCGHCGSKLTLTTSGKAYVKENGEKGQKKRIRYVCYGKTRKQTNCDGQTGYTSHILDGKASEIICQTLSGLGTRPPTQLIYSRYFREFRESKSILERLKHDYLQADKKYIQLKSEVVKTILGESVYSKETLNEMLNTAHEKLISLEAALESAQRKVTQASQQLDKQMAERKEVTWEGLYRLSDATNRRLILLHVVNKVTVRANYEIEIEFKEDMDNLTHFVDFI